MRSQLRSMGAAFQWSAEVITATPSTTAGTSGSSSASSRPGWPTGRWPRSTGVRTTGRWPANRSWAPSGAAGAAARSVEKRDLEQWFLRITKYADELLDFSGIDWPEPIRVQQTNWIGRSEGAEIVFTTAPDDHQPGGDELRVFTTRPDTLFGATFMVLAPEHPLVEKLTAPGPARAESRRTSPWPAARPRSSGCRPIARRPASRSARTRSTRSTASGSRSGWPTTCWPATAPGAIMAVPAHDERDFAFARQFGLEIREVIRARRRAADARRSRRPMSARHRPT